MYFVPLVVIHYEVHKDHEFLSVYVMWNNDSFVLVDDIKNRKVPFITIDPSLDKLKDQNLFPEKLEKANKMLKTAKLPARKLAK